jgi:uncharacterized membrane protein required for colicin V production
VLIDLGIIGIVVFCAWRGYRNGLIRGVFGLVTLIISLILGNIVATAYSEEFTGMLNPFVGGIVDTALVDVAAEGIEYELVEHENDTEEFKSAFNALRYIGLPSSAAAQVAEKAVEDDSDQPLTDSIAQELSLSLAYVAVFAIAFILIAIIFAVIGNLIGFVFSLPGLRLVDMISGAALGLVKGIILIVALAAVIRYFGLLALETLEGTAILNYLVNNNFIANMLGI